MQVLGIDFTSKPSRRKPLTCIRCSIENSKLTPIQLEEWADYSEFEAVLDSDGPWIAGLDFPFGMSRRFIENANWPSIWSEYVMYAHSLGRPGFRESLTSYRENRPKGDKEHQRATDRITGGVSPQKLYGVPVALMFFEGAPRLARTTVSIPHLKKGDPDRIVVEAYPGVLARHFVGRRSYKSDTKKKQTDEQYSARADILREIGKTETARGLGFQVEVNVSLADDPSGDQLDALLCAIQAAWAWQNRESGFGAPVSPDPLEGWIASPFLKS